MRNFVDSHVEYIVPTDVENEKLNSLDDKYLFYSEMSQQEREFLNSLVLRNKPKKLLELGPSCGSSSIVILNAIKNYDAFLFSIDWKTHNFRFPSMLNGFCVEDYPELKTKWKLYTGSLAYSFLDEIGDGIDFVFLDTYHSAPGEILDYLMFLPYLSDDAVIVIHDTNLHTMDSTSFWSKMHYINNMLLNCIYGKKFALGCFLKSESIFPFSNIGGVKICSETKTRLFEIFNLLTHRWQYLFSEKENQELTEFILSKYGDEYAKYFKEILAYQIKQYKKDPVHKIDDSIFL